MKQKSTTTNRGFTLIEIIVSLAVFMVVAVIAVGAFLKVLDANKQSQSLQTAMNNADFALDSMARDIRVGYAYTCYNSYLNQSSSMGKKVCVGGSGIMWSGGIRTYPTIAFYSSEVPTTWASLNCGHPPIHAYRYRPFSATNTTAGGVIEKYEETSCDTGIGDPTDPFEPLTATGFNIIAFGISVDGVTSPQQPKVFMYMKASAGSNLQNQTIFTLQTSVSQRIVNGQ